MPDFMYDSSDVQMKFPLFLCIEEHDNKDDTSLIDNKLFILWDNNTEDYFVTGKRQQGNENSYSYRYQSINELYNFIECTVGAYSTTSIVLFNFINVVGIISDELTYVSFDSNSVNISEIVRYDNVKLNKDGMFAVFEDIKKN